MSKIRVLSDHLANQIAAGEVVERPASVVKELLENALDAGADRIALQVEGDGTRLIRIVDNGVGMDQDDVLLSLERHATSKLLEESQLSAITTLGFRGEALPSIGSVSRMSILSRLQNADIGTKAEVRYGTLHDLHEHGCACGTIIEVRNLFGNLPARKKFLKTKRTELFHIEEVIRNQALAHPEISFALQVDGRKTITLAGVDREQRIRDVFRYSGRMLDITWDGEADELMLRGFLLLPDTSSNAPLRILVNNRPVQDRMIRYAVAEGMKGLLMKGQQPAGALLLDLDPQQVDINVHPAKREIRFRSPHEIRRFLVRAVSEAVLCHQEEVRSELFRPRSDEHRRGAPLGSPLHSAQVEQVQSALLSSGYLSTTENKSEPQPERQVYSAEPLPFSSFSATGKREEGRERERIQEDGLQVAPEQQNVSLSSLRKQTASQSRQAAEPAVVPQGDPEYPGQQEARHVELQEYSGLRLIGQFLNLYLLCERDGELVVIDQHAAHERILYQQLRSAYEQRAVAVQNLLFPVTVELGPDHADILEQEAEAVASLGLKVEFFGDTTWVIKAVPAMVGKAPPQEILFDILDGLSSHSGASRSEVLPEFIENVLASMACKAAIKSGNHLHPEEMLALLRQMEQSEFFSHCPHGRPVLKTFSRLDVEKWFRRV